MRKNRTIFLVIITIFVIVAAGLFSTDEALAADEMPTIIYGNEKTFLQRHAAAELVKYLGQATNKEIIALPAEKAAEAKNKNYFLLGNPAANPAVKEILAKTGATTINIPESAEGFLIQPLNIDNKNYILIAGGSDVGTLYGVYYYLEKYAGVGFFLDAERVPRLKKVPFDNIKSTVRTPRFRYRNFIGSLGPDFGTGIKPFRGHYFTVEENDRYIDWMVKNNLNMTLTQLGPREGGIYEELNPGKKLDQFRWPPEYRKMMFKHIGDYARERGMIVWYHGSIFFVLNNNGMKYHRVEDLEESKLWKKALDYFGTDHLYLGTMGEEALSEKLLEEHVSQLKIMSTMDPEARAVFDTWDLYVREVPKAEAMKYINTLPEDCLIYDTALDWMPTYKKYNYYDGRSWTIGIIHSMTPWDLLHSQIRHYVEVFKGIAADPEASNCEGMISMPENIVPNYDALFGYAIGKLAYNPDYVEYEQLLADYARLRYGRQAAPQMLKAIKLLEKFNNDEREPNQVHVNYKWYVNFPYHRAVWGWARPHKWFEPVLDFQQLYRFRLGWDLDILGRALAQALSCSKLLKDEVPYQNDVFEIARTYTTEVLSNQILLSIYYYKQATLKYAEDNPTFGDQFRGQFTAVAEDAYITMGLLGELLACNERYSMKKMLDDITRVPGAHPDAEKRTKDQFWWGDGYMRNESYEGFQYVYRLETEAFFELLSQRLQNRKTDLIKFPIDSFTRRMETIRKEYIDRIDYLPHKDRNDIIKTSHEILQKVTIPNPPPEAFIRKIKIEQFYPPEKIDH